MRKPGVLLLICGMIMNCGIVPDAAEFPDAASFKTASSAVSLFKVATTPLTAVGGLLTDELPLISGFTAASKTQKEPEKNASRNSSSGLSLTCGAPVTGTPGNGQLSPAFLLPVAVSSLQRTNGYAHDRRMPGQGTSVLLLLLMYLVLLRRSNLPWVKHISFEQFNNPTAGRGRVFHLGRVS